MFYEDKKIDSWDATNQKYANKDDEKNNRINKNSFWGIDGNLRDFIYPPTLPLKC